MTLIFAIYVIKPLFPNCDIPDDAVRLLAAAAICKSHNLINLFIYLKNLIYIFSGFLTFLNSSDVRVTTKLQDVFMFLQIGALGLVINTGLAAIYDISWSER